MACATHGPRSLCGPECAGFIGPTDEERSEHAERAERERAERAELAELAAELAALESMPEGEDYPEPAPGEAAEHLGQSSSEPNASREAWCPQCGYRGPTVVIGK